MMTRHVEKETQGFVNCLHDSCPYGTPLSFTFSYFFSMRADKSTASSTVCHFPL